VKQNARTTDSLTGLRLFLILDATVRLLLWGGSLALATGLFTSLGLWPAGGLVGASLRHAWDWACILMQWIIAYNLVYVVLLILVRLPIPTPREGRYELVPGRIPDRQLVWSCLLATLTKARFEAAFPAILVFHTANLPPLCWLMSGVFGPKSKSCYVTDPRLIDPHLISIGRNVVIGLGATIAAHYQEQGVVIIKRSIIEDDVVIGANAVMSGVHVQRGAIIAAGAVVLPGSVVGPNEYWSGNPARRRRELSGHPASSVPALEASSDAPILEA